MIKIISAFSIIFFSGCVSFGTTDVWDKVEKSKRAIGTPTTKLEFTNNSKLVKVSKKEIEYNLDYTQKEIINSENELTFNVTKKLFIPCKDLEEAHFTDLVVPSNNEVRKEEGLCAKNDKDSDYYETKFTLYSNLALASIFLVGLVPSWYSYYQAKQEEGKVKTDTKIVKSKEEKETKLSPINGYLLLGSNLKSKKYPIKEGKLKIPTNEFLSYYFDSLPTFKESQSDSFTYKDITHIVSNEIKDEELSFYHKNQTKENEPEDENNKTLEELEKQFNEKTCKKFDRKKLDEFGDNFLSSINYSRGSTPEESKELDKFMHSKEFYCSNFYNELDVKMISRKLETLNRQSQGR